MKISRINVYQTDLPLREGRYNWSNDNSVAVFDATIVEVETDQGISGYGESTPLGPAYLPAYAAGVRAGLTEIAPKLIGMDPTDLGALNRRMDALLRGHPYVKSALDIACWDILGQAAGMPVYLLLGGRAQEDLKLYRAISQEEPALMARKIEGYRAEGYTKFQLKVGGDPDRDIVRIRECREILAPQEVLIADANTGWTMHEAARVVAAVKDLDVYIEQPCPTYEECLSVRERTALPFVLDEVIDGIRTLLRGIGDRAFDQPQDLQGRRAHPGAADARSVRCRGHRDDHRGHVGRRFRHGRHRASCPVDAGRVPAVHDRLQQLRHAGHRHRRAQASQRRDECRRHAGNRLQTDPRCTRSSGGNVPLMHARGRVFVFPCA